jgi:hypothetical protein
MTRARLGELMKTPATHRRPPLRGDAACALPDTRRVTILITALLTCLITCGASLSACTTLARLGAVNESAFGAEQDRQREVFPWQGEEMAFDVSIGGVKAMNLKVAVGYISKAQDGTEVIPISGDGQTFGLFALGYPLNDSAQAFIHPRTWKPFFAVKDINERGKHRVYNVHYWFEERYAAIEKDRDGELSTENIPIPRATFDVVSFVYTMRSIDSTPGTQETWVVYDGWKLNHIYLVVQPGEEEILTPLGVFPCFRVDMYREILDSHDPLGAISGAFLDPEMTVRDARYFAGNLWITKDGRRLPAQLALSTQRLGDIILKINHHKPPGGGAAVAP